MAKMLIAVSSYLLCLIVLHICAQRGCSFGCPCACAGFGKTACTKSNVSLSPAGASWVPNHCAWSNEQCVSRPNFCCSLKCIQHHQQLCAASRQRLIVHCNSSSGDPNVLQCRAYLIPFWAERPLCGNGHSLLFFPGGSQRCSGMRSSGAACHHRRHQHDAAALHH